VFPVGFGLPAAQAVAGAGAGQDEWSMLESLSSLVDKSLILADTSGLSARYTMLETVHEFVQARLVEEDGTAVLAELRERHASYYLGLVESVAPRLRTADHAASFAALRSEFPNIRLTFSYLIDQPDRTRDAMRLVASLYRFLRWGGHDPEILGFTDLLRDRAELEAADPLAVQVWLVRLTLLARSDPASALEPFQMPPPWRGPLVIS
jgi:predicted ATPase